MTYNDSGRFCASVLARFRFGFLREPAMVTGGAPEHDLAQALVLNHADRLSAGWTDNAGAWGGSWQFRQAPTGTFNRGTVEAQRPKVPFALLLAGGGALSRRLPPT